MPSGVQHTSTPCGRNSAHKLSAKLTLNAFTAEYTASSDAPARQAKRSDENDAAATAFAHRGREVPGHRHRTDARQLDLLHRVLERVVEKLDRPVRGSGVVDDQSDLQPVGGLGDALRDVGNGQVKHHRPDLDAVSFAHASRNLGQQRLVTRDQHEIQSALGQLVGQARANPLGCACDDRPSAVLLREIICHDEPPPPLSSRGVCADLRRIRHPSGPRTSSSS